MPAESQKPRTDIKQILQSLGDWVVSTVHTSLSLAVVRKTEKICKVKSNHANLFMRCKLQHKIARNSLGRQNLFLVSVILLEMSTQSSMSL